MSRRVVDIAASIPVDPNLWTVDDWRDLHEAIRGLRQKIGERHANKAPAWKCRRCGEQGFFVGVFSASRFDRQTDDFREKHRDCPLSIDGGGI